MKRLLPLALSIVTCLCLLLATERRALAYVDPGSGMLALQSFAAGVAALGYFLRRRVLALFGRNKKPAPVALPTPLVLRKEDSRNAA